MLRQLIEEKIKFDLASTKTKLYHDNAAQLVLSDGKQPFFKDHPMWGRYCRFCHGSPAERRP